MKKIITVVALILCVFFLGYEAFKKINTSVQTFDHTVDSLHRVNDSLTNRLTKDAFYVDSLLKVQDDLNKKVAYQKTKVKVIERLVDSSKRVVDSFTDRQLISSFNTRYPLDTLSNPLPLAHPVLVASAKDLIELDGAKQLIQVKDSILNLNEQSLNLKDTVIKTQASQISKYKRLTMNKDMELAGWSLQYNTLEKETKKLRKQNKYQKVAAFILAGTLTYAILHK